MKGDAKKQKKSLRGAKRLRNLMEFRAETALQTSFARNDTIKGCCFSENPYNIRRYSRVSLHYVCMIAVVMLLIIPVNVSYAADRFEAKCLVIGIDGMDPDLLGVYLKQGKMPNFQKIIDSGGDLKKLKTTAPPQSPVAWASFSIGANPGKHGIFDFIHRNPQTLIPYLSITKTEGSQTVMPLGRWQVPLSPGEVVNLRGGKPFWHYLSEHGIDATVMQVPANYPPTHPDGADNLRALSGMGTPDLNGTQGTFSFYTSVDTGLKETIGGGAVYRVTVDNGRVDALMYGPPHPYKNPKQYDNDGHLLTAAFTVWIDKENNVARLDISGQEIILQPGTMSRWVEVEFPVIPYIQSVSGIVKFYLRECHPDFKLYVSPVNINPRDPALPITYPHDFAHRLYDEFGYFYTQNMPPDTKALEHGILSDDQFLEQTYQVFKEEEQRLYGELDDFKRGFLFHYFCVNDQLSHTFFRAVDPAHPLYSEELHEKYGNVLENLYRGYDRIIGNVLDRIDSDTLLIVMSDHGFASFRRGVNLNTILLNKGYISLKNPDEQGQHEYFDNVDWDNTMAYNLGINSLYINLFERERHGMVFMEEYEQVREQIRKMLLAYVDPHTGEHPIRTVYRREDIYSGDYLDQAPDLIIGFERGYRASWDTILGKMPKDEIVDNTSPWSGDHCISDDVVPGIILCNRPIIKDKPEMTDIAPTILACFGIEPGSGMEGEPIITFNKEGTDVQTENNSK